MVAVTATAIIASQTKTNNNNNNNNLRSDQNNPQPKNDLKSGAALAQTAGLLTANVAINNDTKKSWQAEDDKMEKYNWENLTLRKTHLFPQESIKGSVLFPVKNHVFALKYLKFRFPIENTEKIFLFKQKWINSAFE